MVDSHNPLQSFMSLDPPSPYGGRRGREKATETERVWPDGHPSAPSSPRLHPKDRGRHRARRRIAHCNGYRPTKEA